MIKTVQLLLIEDDRDDVDLLELSLANNNISYNLKVIYDGATAMDFFHTDNEIPQIIILDFNLPKIHGREILKAYNSSDYAHIPLVVLTTSSAPEDKDYSLKNGANSFMIKPNTRAGLDEMVGSIMDIIDNHSPVL